MELFRLELDGSPRRAGGNGTRLGVAPPGVAGVDVAPRTVAGEPFTVVQVLFDDDDPAFDRTLLEAPLVAELVTPEGETWHREPFDHDRFRRQLAAERRAQQSTTRGVLLLVDGQLPPPWVRLAFLPVGIAATAGSELVVRRTTAAELTAGAHEAHQRGDITDAQRDAVLTAIEQRHPGDR
jgi:hypothetical protein